MAATDRQGNVRLPTFDAHAHLRPGTMPEALEGAGAVLAMTLTLDEWATAQPMAGGVVAVGIGCHPRHVAGQAAFDGGEFERLVQATAVVGEVGLDAGSRVPADQQLRTFRSVLGSVSRAPRLVSIHSTGATRDVLDELRRQPVEAPILHGWRGGADQTREAVRLGCRFSIGAPVVRRPTWRSIVPPTRLLLESDQGWADPPSAIPPKLAWLEELLAARVGRTAQDLRVLLWCNLADAIRATGTIGLWPAGVVERLPAA